MDLVGKNPFVAIALEHCLRAVPAPGEAVAHPGVAKVADQKVFVQRLSEIDEILVCGVDALGIGEHAGVFLPDAEVMLFMNIVDFTFPGRVAEANNLADKMPQAVSLKNNHRA